MRARIYVFWKQAEYTRFTNTIIYYFFQQVNRFFAFYLFFCFKLDNTPYNDNFMLTGEWLYAKIQVITLKGIIYEQKIFKSRAYVRL